MPRVAWPIELDAGTQAELRRLVRAPSTSQAVALRARIILAAVRGRANKDIAAALGASANTVAKWRGRFCLFSVNGLKNLGHGGRPRKHGPQVQEKLRRLLRQSPPDGRERWTIDDLSHEMKVPRSTVHEMLVVGDFRSRRQPARRRRQ